MDPRLRTLLFGLAASAVAVWVGITLAMEQRFVATLAAALCAGVLCSWTRGPLPEAWLLGFLFLGYVIGDRGFAQISPFTNLPLFFSELGLAAALGLTLFRGALRRELPWRRDWLNGCLLFWLALGSGRIASDVRAFGFIALRDFALVYYVLYFFVAEVLAGHAPSRRVLHGALLGTFALLPLTGTLAVLFPEFFLSHLLVDGVPLIFYKGDLLATFLFTGYLVLLPAGHGHRARDLGRWAAAVGSLVLGLTLLSRAPLVGLLVASGWLALAGRWRPFRVLVAVALAGLLAVTVGSLLQRKSFTQTKAYAVYEAVVSIGDFSGTRDYQNDLSSNKGDNNRFRIVWWRNVAQETLATAPLLGLGFGADLAHGFLNEYYPTEEPDFSARSPHNVFMTTLGRMGLVGAAALAGVYFLQGRQTWRTARAARADPGLQPAMTLQAAVWVVMVSACLGVVLEGPMGAIPFWIMLGLAHQAAHAGEPVTAPLPAGAAAV